MAAATVATMPAGAAPGAPAASAAGVPAGAPGAPPQAPSSNAATLWVGDLSTDPEVTAQELFDEFSSHAEVASLRLCRDKTTNASRGYAYVNFKSVEEASKAMEALNYTMFKGQPCRIMWANKDRASRSSSSANIVFKNLSETVTPKTLHDLASLYGPVASCKMPRNRETGKFQGHGFVQFETEAAAAEAIEELDGTEYEGTTISLERYKSREDRLKTMRWTNLYMKQYPRSWTEEQIRTLLEPYGEVTSLKFDTKDGKGLGFCFANFADSESAKAASEALNGKEIPNPDHVPASDTTEASGGPPMLSLVAVRAESKLERQRAMLAENTRKKREFLQTAEGRNVYVKNLDERVDNDKLKAFFAKFGTVESVRVQRDAEGNSLLFGMVLFATAAEAQKAVTTANKSVLDGKPLYVSLWQPKTKRQAMLASSRRAPMPMGMHGGRYPMREPMGMHGGYSPYGMAPGMNPGMPWGGMRPVAYNGMRTAGMQPAPYPGMGGRPGGAPMHMGAPAHVPSVPPAHAGAMGGATAPDGSVPAAGGAPHTGAPAATATARPGAPAAAADAAGTAAGATGASALPSAAALIEMDPGSRQRAIGSRLFPLVRAIDADRAPKITGMLLQGMEVTDLLGLLQSPEELRQSVVRAQDVLVREAAAPQ